jgi:hypothetical protein
MGQFLLPLTAEAFQPRLGGVVVHAAWPFAAIDGLGWVAIIAVLALAILACQSFLAELLRTCQTLTAELLRHLAGVRVKAGHDVDVNVAFKDEPPSRSTVEAIDGPQAPPQLAEPPSVQ